MSGSLASLVRDLSAMPLFGVSATLAAYAVALRLHQWSGRAAWTAPVLLAIAGLASILWLSGIPYGRFFVSAAPIHHVLGPIVVLLSVPLYRQLRVIRRAGTVVAVALLVGSVTAVGSALGAAWTFTPPPELTLALAAKSATAPIGIGFAEKLGTAGSLTAVLTVMAGVTGGVLGPAMLKMLRVRDGRAAGLALGIASHGIGTATAFRVSEVAGVFASIGMSLNAILMAVLLPLLFGLR